jgi:hypothetical protein
LEIVPGASVGPIVLESSLGDAFAQLGEPDLNFVSDAIGFARYEELGLELVFTSPEISASTDDSVVIAIGVKKDSGFSGEIGVGQTRAEVEAKLGDAADEVGAIRYYAGGVSASYDAEQRVEEIGIFAPFQNVVQPPEMEPAPEGSVTP